MLDRSDEIRKLIRSSPEQVIKQAGKHLFVCDSLDQLHHQFANEMVTEIEQHNQDHLPTRLILPIGPIGQYTYVVERCTREQISLANCWFFFMDEYCDNYTGKALNTHHPLSFQGIANKLLLDQLTTTCNLNPTHVFFPNEKNIHELARIIQKIGGIDTCYGGIGIHGHLAFNEPAPRIAVSPPRKVKLNRYTITMNAIRAGVGGDLENFPRNAFTLGMTQILDARRIQLYCRNGTPYDWANVVLRIALFGEIGDDYPVTHIRNREYVIITDRDTIQTPNVLL